MKICIVLGTRPEIIKLSPVIRECKSKDLDYFIIHTNQHYSSNLDQIFFDELSLPQPKYNLEVGSASHGKQTGAMLAKLEEVFMKEDPDIVLVQGDTNTVLAGALAASKMNIKVGHVEAGLRSYYREMPEEINRVLADHCSDILFPPTEKSKKILLGEGIPTERIFVTGNTVVDAVFQNLEIAKKHSSILEELGLEPENYFLLTAHRQENVDFKERFKGILKGVQLVYDTFKLPIIYPIHPRAKKMLDKFQFSIPAGLVVIKPLGYLDFLKLESSTKVILTDSGGVQEEACVLGVPCVTLRDNTERPETLEIRANILVGTNSTKILEAVEESLISKTVWDSPFGDGNAGKNIINFLIKNLT